MIDVKIDTKAVEEGLKRYNKALQEKVLFGGVAAIAKVLYDEVKLNTSPPRMGRVTGNLHESIYRAYSPERSSETRKTYRISWRQKGGEHGHLMEFGTVRMAARPFIRPAFDLIDEALKAGTSRMRSDISNGVLKVG